jgi:hypothetical protein
MIKSMTGFAAVTVGRRARRSPSPFARSAIGISTCSCGSRMLAAMDVRAVMARIARPLELGLSLQLRQPPACRWSSTRISARAPDGARTGALRGLVAGALTPGDLLRIPQAITIRDRQVTDDGGAGGAGIAGAPR